MVAHGPNLVFTNLSIIAVYHFSFSNKSSTRNCTPGEREPYREPSDDFLSNIPYPFERSLPTVEVGLKCAFYVPAIAVAVTGNLLVLVVVVRNKRLHSATYYYIANLALSDLLVGGFNMWVHLVPGVSVNWPFGATLCEIAIFFRTLAIVASALFLTVVAAERFFSIVYPLKMRVTKPVIHVVVVSVCWSAAVLVALPTIFTRTMFVIEWRDYDQKFCSEVWPRYITGPDPDQPRACLYDYPSRRLYYVLQVVVMYVVPVLCMLLAYSTIYYCLHKRRAPGVQTDSILALQTRTRRKVLRMLVVVFVLFVVCYTPQEVILLHQSLVTGPDYNLPSWLSFSAVYLVYLNSALNPVLYGGLNDNFRRALVEVMCCRTWRRRNQVASKPINGRTNIHTSDTSTTRTARKDRLAVPSTSSGGGPPPHRRRSDQARLAHTYPHSPLPSISEQVLPEVSVDQAQHTVQGPP